MDCFLRLAKIGEAGTVQKLHKPVIASVKSGGKVPYYLLTGYMYFTFNTNPITSEMPISGHLKSNPGYNACLLP